VLETLSVGSMFVLCHSCLSFN